MDKTQDAPAKLGLSRMNKHVLKQLKAAIQKNSNAVVLSPEEVEAAVVTKHFTDLDDYIYDLFSDPLLRNQPSMQNRESLVRFDCLDFVVIDVDARILPWMLQA